MLPQVGASCPHKASSQLLTLPLLAPFAVPLSISHSFSPLPPGPPHCVSFLHQIAALGCWALPAATLLPANEGQAPPRRGVGAGRPQSSGQAVGTGKGGNEAQEGAGAAPWSHLLMAGLGWGQICR